MWMCVAFSLSACSPELAQLDADPRGDAARDAPTNSATLDSARDAVPPTLDHRLDDGDSPVSRDAQALDAPADAAKARDSAPTDATPDGSIDSRPPDATSLDAFISDVSQDAWADAPTTTFVTPAREMRGLWIPTVYGINFPSSASASATTQQAELRAIVDLCVTLKINSIFFQVRPESDALYRSSLEPFSRFLTGTQGRDPGYDPLQTLIEAAHEQGIEVHAWLNPYRAKVSASSATASNHLSRTHTADALTYGTLVWMNPGARAVEDHVVNVATDIATRYEVDGIHLDDYFYPYPSGAPFPDDATYETYVTGGGSHTRADWRRDNVNRLVERIAAAVRAVAPHARFGISPFGIYRPGMPAGVRGLDQYADLFADPLEWLRRGAVDYIAPQLYWATAQVAPSSTGQPYRTLIEFWTAAASANGVQTWTGNSLTDLGTGAWTAAEIAAQLAITRSTSSNGYLLYHAGPLRSNTSGIANQFRDMTNSSPALPPVVTRPTSASSLYTLPAPPTVPQVSASGTMLTLDHAGLPAADGGLRSLRGFAIYRVVNENMGVITLELVQLAPPRRSSYVMQPGDYFVTALDRFAQESARVRARISAP